MAPLPDIATYVMVTGTYGGFYWKWGRGQCAKCERMYTLGKDIRYRGYSKEENLICNRCFRRKKKNRAIPQPRKPRHRRPVWRARPKN